jgi:integrase
LEFELWTVPADHMKRAKSHIVPLSRAALALLNRAAALKLAGSEFVFPGVQGGAMSDMTLLKVLRDAGEPYHVHGFRSAFTDWSANEGFPDAVVEAALAHKTPDAVQLPIAGQPIWGRLTNRGNGCGLWRHGEPIALC